MNLCTLKPYHALLYNFAVPCEPDVAHLAARVAEVGPGDPLVLEPLLGEHFVAEVGPGDPLVLEPLLGEHFVAEVGPRSPRT